MTMITRHLVINDYNSNDNFQMKFPGQMYHPVQGLPGHHVAKADGAERDEAEVAAVEEAPVLP